MSLFTTPAWAQDAATAAGSAPEGSAFAQFIPLILIVIVFYFLLFRPQQKRFKEHQQMLDALRRGDRIVTNGGIVGTIKKVESDESMLQVEIAPDVTVQVARSMVSEVVSRTTPAKSEEKSDKKNKRK